jgi:hypothetical protein
MPHARKTGTAWDIAKDDFAYTRDLDRTGWAWEFLRLNEAYQKDYRLNWAGAPLAVSHESGGSIYRPSKRFLDAEDWGLAFFADPEKSTHETDVFWLPELVTHTVHCQTGAADEKTQEPLSLMSFRGRHAVLDGPDREQIKISSRNASVNLLVDGGTFLCGDRAIFFGHEGFNTESQYRVAIQILKRFTVPSTTKIDETTADDSKYLDYLIALEGHLEGRSYREIATVLYGNSRIRETWNHDTHGYKLRVRRAVAQGLYLMNQGYRKLL